MPPIEDPTHLCKAISDFVSNKWFYDFLKKNENKIQKTIFFLLVFKQNE
jgi:hypothetical protein